MSEMLVQPPDPQRRILDCYDFLLSGGITQAIYICKEEGDTIRFGDLKVTAHILPRPNPTNPSQTLPEEEITIYTNQILTINHRVIEQVALTPEQQIEWDKIIQEVGGSRTVQ